MRLSIIIPVLNEADTISGLLQFLINHSDRSVEEIIVVDGGSRDATIQNARSKDVTVYEAPDSGRALQMNYGARKAKGDTLYFLHADTRPPSDFDCHIEKALQQGASAGCFRLRFDTSNLLLRIYAWFTRFDIDAFRFGDQSLFVRREIFREIGGFKENLTVMEDNEIIGRLRKHGTFRLLPQSVTTSSRKYESVGPLKLQWWFTVIFLLYHLGVSQERLVAIYRRFIAS